MSEFVGIYSVPKLSFSATYKRKAILTLFTFKYINDIIRIAIKWSFQYIKSLVGVYPFKIGSIIYSFTDLTRTFLPQHGLDMPSASTLGKTARTT